MTSKIRAGLTFCEAAQKPSAVHRTANFAFRISEGIRTAKVQDTTYTVIPVVAIVEGVLWPVNAPSPELALASEFGKWPESWNGRPVVMNHPEINGVKVSANRLDVLSQGYFGNMFNTTVGESAKIGKFLQSEIWIDETRLPPNSEITASLERMKKGEDVEVSVGAFVQLEDVKGEFNGKGYEGVWRNVVPDHLAILSAGSTGACSNAMGCGAPRTALHHNLQEDKWIVATPKISLSAAEAGGVNTLEVSEMSEWRKAGAADASDPAACKCQDKGPIGRALESLGKLLNLKFRAGELSDVDRRTAILVALQKKLGDRYFWIMAVFSNKVVYESYDDGLIQVDYTMSEDGTVTIGANAIKVRPETQFVAATEEIMNKEAKVTALIACTHNKFGESDRTYLMGLSEEILDKMALSSPPTPAPTAAAATAPVATPVVPAPAATPVTLEGYISAAPENIRGTLSAGVTLLASQRATVIKALMDKKCPFTQVELEGKSMDELAKLSAMAGIATTTTTTTTTPDTALYSLQSAGQAFVARVAEDQAIPLPESIWPAPTAKQ